MFVIELEFIMPEFIICYYKKFNWIFNSELIAIIIQRVVFDTSASVGKLIAVIIVDFKLPPKLLIWTSNSCYCNLICFYWLKY